MTAEQSVGKKSRQPRFVFIATDLDKSVVPTTVEGLVEVLQPGEEVVLRIGRLQRPSNKYHVAKERPKNK
jgi:hypothetical protein